MHSLKSTRASYARIWSVTAASLVAVSLAAVPSALAGTVHATPAPSYLYGSLACARLGGLVKYSPPLSAADAGKSLSVTFVVATKSCKAKETTGQSTPPLVTGMSWTVHGSVAAKLPFGTQGPSSAPLTASGFPLAGSLAVQGLPGVQTAFTFSNLNVGRGTEGHMNLTYPGTNGFASVTGAFQGTDFGFGSSGSLILGVSATEMKAMYNGPGISAIRVIGGKLTLQ
jgi:hypothetical protein